MLRFLREASPIRLVEWGGSCFTPLLPPSAARRLPEGYQILYSPAPICDTSAHSRGHAKSTMNLDEVAAKRTLRGKSGASLRIEPAAKASPGKSSRVTDPHHQGEPRAFQTRNLEIMSKRALHRHWHDRFQIRRTLPSITANWIFDFGHFSVTPVTWSTEAGIVTKSIRGAKRQ
jgi:hypothetical protein